MTLIENWQHIAAKSWSSRLAWLAAAVSGLEVLLPTLQALIPETVIAPGTFATIALLISAAGGIARLVAQPKMAADIEAEKA